MVRITTPQGDYEIPKAVYEFGIGQLDRLCNPFKVLLRKVLSHGPSPIPGSCSWHEMIAHLSRPLEMAFYGSFCLHGLIFKLLWLSAETDTEGFEEGNLAHINFSPFYRLRSGHV